MELEAKLSLGGKTHWDMGSGAPQAKRSDKTTKQLMPAVWWSYLLPPPLPGIMGKGDPSAKAWREVLLGAVQLIFLVGIFDETPRLPLVLVVGQCQSQSQRLATSFNTAVCPLKKL